MSNRILQMLGVLLCGSNLCVMFSLGTLMTAFDWWQFKKTDRQEVPAIMLIISYLHR